MKLSNCCEASITPPGWPDSDICSECGEHCDVWEGDIEIQVTNLRKVCVILTQFLISLLSPEEVESLVKQIRAIK